MSGSYLIDYFKDFIFSYFILNLLSLNYNNITIILIILCLYFTISLKFSILFTETPKSLYDIFNVKFFGSYFNPSTKKFHILVLISYTIPR